MIRKTLLAIAATTTLCGLSLAVAPASAAPVSAGPFVQAETGLLEPAQYYGPPRRYYGPRRHYGPPRYYGPRRYYGPPRFYGPPPPPVFVPPVVPFYGPRYYY